MLPPTEMLNRLLFGTSLVLTKIKPPLKSAGYSGAGDFTTSPAHGESLRKHPCLVSW